MQSAEASIRAVTCSTCSAGVPPTVQHLLWECAGLHECTCFLDLSIHAYEDWINLKCGAREKKKCYYPFGTLRALLVSTEEFFFSFLVNSFLNPSPLGCQAILVPLRCNNNTLTLYFLHLSITQPFPAATLYIAPKVLEYGEFHLYFKSLHAFSKSRITLMIKAKRHSHQHLGTVLTPRKWKIPFYSEVSKSSQEKKRISVNSSTNLFLLSLSHISPLSIRSWILIQRRSLYVIVYQPC